MGSRVLRILSAIGLAVALAGAAQAQFGTPGGGLGGGGLGGGGLGGGSGGGQPQPQPQPQGLLQTVSPEQVAGLLGQVGFTGPQMGNSNDPKFKFMKLTANGIGVGTVFVAFYNCESNGCPTYQFIMMFGKQNVDAKFINNYNNNAIVAKLVETQQGDLWLVSGGLVAGGVSPAQILNSAKLFIGSVQLLTNNQ